MTLAEQPFHLLSNQSPDAIFLTREGRLDYLNDMAGSLVGANQAIDLVGQPFAARLLPPVHNLGSLLLQPEPGSQCYCSLNLQQMDGSSVWVEATVICFTDNASTVVLIVAQPAVITAQSPTAENQLTNALALNKTILEASSSAIIAFRQDGQCVLANPAASRLTGGSHEELLRQNFRELESWRRAGLLKAAERVLQAGTTETLERKFISTFGRELWAELQMSKFEMDGTDHLLLTMNDITEKRRAQETLANRELAFRTLTEHLPDNILRYAADGRVLFANPTMERTLGLPLARIIGRRLSEFKHDANCHKVESAVSEVASSGTPQELELVIYSPEGEPRYHHIKLVPEPGPDGQAVSVLAVGHDLTELKVAAEEVRLFASVFRSSAEGVLITDSRGTIISVNPAFTQITGYSADEALGNTPRMLRSDRQPPEFYTAMWEQIHREGQWQGEIWNRRKDGEAFLEWLTINRIDGEDGRPVRYAAVFHDITELRLKDEHIEHLAFHDALTGLPNRELLLERIHQAVKHSRAKQNRFSVTFIDLDRFKGVNDALGHDIGDCLLQIIGERIKRRLRKIDTVARVGGDEFVVLMENLNSPRQCASMAQILLDDIARPIELPGYKLEISASMGMGFFPEDGDESIELMKRADMAMYAAKAAGGNTYRFFRDEMLERTSHRLNMEMDLRRATVQNELELFYQPKIAFADDSVVGVEALVRWRHPEKGMQSPGEFIPLAEESTLICDIGAWVINEACRQVARWRSQGLNLPIAINISARQLETQDLLTRIRNLTKLHEVPISQIELELTESVIMEDPETVSVFLRQCREAGMRVAVDDFGTGYSSLAYLRRLPLDVLKIDRSFVLDAVDDEEDAQIVKTILALGQSLKLEVVAEGIETEAQAALLRRYGCDIAQGYLHARPMPATEFEHWIKTYQSSLS